MRDNSISIRIEDYRENHDILEYLENSKYDALRSDKERKEERRNGGKLMWNDMRSSDGAYIIAEREKEREYRRLELLFITLVIINGTVMADDELCGGARRNFIRIRASFVDSINFIRPHSLSLSLSRFFSFSR